MVHCRYSPTRHRKRRSTWKVVAFVSSLAVAGGFTPSISSPALRSPLFRRLDRPMLRQQNDVVHNSWFHIWVGLRRKRSTRTARHMVLRTPESIIEEASTQNLLDDLIDESVRTASRRPIMMQFDPSSGWIWRRWSGTVFSETWTSCVRNMVWATVVAFVCHSVPGIRQEAFSKFDTLWGQLLSVTTFTLTFFLNQSYALWRKCYGYSRRLQGRLNDLGMTLATHAARKTPSNPNEPSTYTSASRQLLELTSRYIRVFNLLTYASFTRSHRPILTPRGMRRLVERGILTPQERQVLVDAQVPATQRHNAVLIWITRLFIEGRREGHFLGGAGFEEQFLEKFHVIRAQYGAIGDELQGRMPLAYAHIVQVLVDVVLWLYPFMAFSIGMTPLLGALGSGFLTISYQGLFDLAKQFLDPYDNESFGKGEDPLSVDTLIAETNAGSVRWINGFEQQPFSSQRISDGELFDYQLPVRGYSVEELAQMEADKLKKEQEAQEKREREEAERLEQEAAELEEEAAELEAAQQIEDDQEEEEEEEGIEETMTLAEMKDDEKFAKENVGEALVNGDETEHVVEKTQSASSSEMEETESVNGEKAEQEEDETPQDGMSVHTVTSIEGGLPVTLDTPEPEVVEVPQEEETDPVSEDSEILLETESGILDAKKETKKEMEPAVNGSREKKVKMQIEVANGDSMDEDNNDDLDDPYDESMLLDPDDLEWFDEVGPDGQEYRLSQMMADEEWEEEKLYAEEMKKEKAPMTFEEYTQKAAEIMERVESELIETEEILKESPGAQAALDAKERPSLEDGGSSPDGTSIESPPIQKRGDGSFEEKTQTPYYDQTKLDPISQLWGLAPDEALGVKPQNPGKMLNEDVSFDCISQLWGDTVEHVTKPASKEPPEMIDSGNFDSISQLWGDDNNDMDEDDVLPIWKRGDEGEEGGILNAMAGDRNSPVYDGLEWFEEAGPDGQEYRLSQMLADEVWEEEVKAQMEAPITLEDYSKQMAELQEAAEDELKETEAILNMPPGASDFELDEEQAPQAQPESDLPPSQ